MTTRTTATTTFPPAAAPLHAGRMILHAAWLAIALGLVMELALVIVKSAFGQAIKHVDLIADGAGKISWSVFVCVGLALGTAVTKASVPITGLLGAISAPIGFTIARSSHKSAAEGLSASGAPGDLPSPILLATVKGAEYLVLGVLLAWIGRKVWGGFKAHLGAGAAIGAVFSGVFMLILVASVDSPGAFKVAALGVNEFLFPIGCSIGLYAATVLGRRLAG